MYILDLRQGAILAAYRSHAKPIVIVNFDKPEKVDTIFVR